MFQFSYAALLPTIFVSAAIAVPPHSSEFSSVQLSSELAALDGPARTARFVSIGTSFDELSPDLRIRRSLELVASTASLGLDEARLNLLSRVTVANPQTWDQAMVTLERGRLLRKSQKWDDAIDSLHRAELVLIQLARKNQQSECYECCLAAESRANALEAMGRLTDAESAWMQLQTLAQEFAQPTSIAWATYKLGTLAKARGDSAKAQGLLLNATKSFLVQPDMIDLGLASWRESIQLARETLPTLQYGAWLEAARLDPAIVQSPAVVELGWASLIYYVRSDTLDTQRLDELVALVRNAEVSRVKWNKSTFADYDFFDFKVAIGASAVQDERDAGVRGRVLLLEVLATLPDSDEFAKIRAKVIRHLNELPQ